MRSILATLVFTAATLGAAGGVRAAENAAPAPHTMYAIVKNVRQDALIVERRDGRLVTVDIRAARVAGRTGVLYAGRAVALHGDYDALHAFHAVSITGAAGIKYNRGSWPQDQ